MLLTTSLPLPQQSAGLPDARTAEAYVLRMIAAGDIWASIDQRDGKKATSCHVTDTSLTHH